MVEQPRFLPFCCPTYLACSCRGSAWLPDCTPELVSAGLPRGALLCTLVCYCRDAHWCWASHFSSSPPQSESRRGNRGEQGLVVAGTGESWGQRRWSKPQQPGSRSSPSQPGQADVLETGKRIQEPCGGLFARQASVPPAPTARRGMRHPRRQWEWSRDAARERPGKHACEAGTERVGEGALHPGW